MKQVETRTVEHQRALEATRWEWSVRSGEFLAWVQKPGRRPEAAFLTVLKLCVELEVLPV